MFSEGFSKDLMDLQLRGFLRIFSEWICKTILERLLELDTGFLRIFPEKFHQRLIFRNIFLI